MVTETDLDFLLNDFIDRVPEVTHAVAVSADGLLVARSRALPTDEADRVAAVASGLVSLLRSAASHFQAGTVVSNLTELQGGFMFCMSVGSGASLLVLASRQCDIGRVSHELVDLINRVGPALTPRNRAGMTPVLTTGAGR
ncbi:MAG: roadblock/LC7 domain-containing protein [Micromonosporaceae bacterium]|nr:roadblock/LC7 domain-containing protein [Micromonosporaceae bacterium]